MSDIPFRCMVQEGCVSPETETVLRRRLGELAQQAFGAPARFNWLTVLNGSGYTAGEPTTCSFVLALSNAPLDQSRRAELLAEICDIWMEETRCSSDEVVAAIGDPRPSGSLKPAYAE